MAAYRALIGHERRLLLLRRRSMVGNALRPRSVVAAQVELSCITELRRNVSFNAPSLSEDRKSILGLDFLSKLFKGDARNAGEAAASGVVKNTSSEEIEAVAADEGAVHAAAEQVEDLPEMQAAVSEVEVTPAAVENATSEVEIVAAEAEVLQNSAAAEVEVLQNSAAAEVEVLQNSAAAEVEVLQNSAAVEDEVLTEVQTVQTASSSEVEILPAAAGSSSFEVEVQKGSSQAEAPSEVQKSSPGAEVLTETAPTESSSSELLVNVEKSSSEVEVVADVQKSSSEVEALAAGQKISLEVEVQPSSTSESSSEAVTEVKTAARELTGIEKFIESLPPLPQEASSKVVDRSVPSPEGVKLSAKSKPAKKPNPVKPSAAVSADATPIYDFLRQKSISPESTPDVSKPSEAAKPPSLKLSLASSQKTSAAINNILDSVEKANNAQTSSPIFDALGAKKQDETPSEGHAPPLKLSLSSHRHERPPMDAQALAAEMNTLLTDGKLAEAVKLFEDWKNDEDVSTQEKNKPDRVLYNLYMQAKLKIGADFNELSEVVKKMEEAGLPRDLAGYNILIRALFRKNDSATAERILQRMEKEDSLVQPDADSYNLVAVMCAFDRKAAAAAKHMKTMISKGFEPSRTTINEVLAAAARTHQTDLATSMLKDLKASGKLSSPMVNTCIELLVSACEVDDTECARLSLTIISERPMAKFGPKVILDEGTMINVIGTAVRANDAALSTQAWETICSHTRGMGRVPSPESFLTRIHALVSFGDLSAAFKALWEFEVCYGRKADSDSELFSPFTSLKSVASACSRGGATSLDTAYYMAEKAHSNKEGVALAALNCIILGCSNLWDSERAFQTFEAIENVFGLRPDIHSCNALLQALGRTRMTEDVLKVYDYIKQAGFKPNSWTYMLLADAHVVNHDSAAALNTLETMVENGLRPLRQTTSKVWSRCKQYDDNDGLDRLKKLESQLNYRHCHLASNRRKLLFDVIGS